MDSGTLERAQRYLAADSVAEIAALAAELQGVTFDLEETVAALRPTPAAEPETGLMPDRGFRSDAFAAQYPDEILPLYVPESYTHEQPHGLVLFLHGGGHSTPREAGGKVFDGYGIRDILTDSGFIVCCPTAPYNEHSFASWNLPEVDAFLADVISELEQFYNIDPDRVFLGGQSMGGMGAVHLAQRLSDRFAGVLAAGSSWDLGFWASVKGTVLWTLQGSNDAVMFRRRHGTDIEFTRLMKMRLDQAGVENVYREHSGGHALTHGRRIVREWLRWAATQRRDPFYPHVVAVSPRGCSPWIDWRRHPKARIAASSEIDFHEVAQAPHLRWVSLGALGSGTIAYDLAETSVCKDDCHEDWDAFKVGLKRKNLRGGIVEAHHEDGLIEVTAVNVKGFTLWLHPAMLDLQNVTVRVNGDVRFEGAVQPDLLTLLDSYKRRRDWGLLYPARITIADDDGAWETRDQIKLGN